MLPLACGNCATSTYFRQGAEEYLINVLNRKNVNSETAQRIQAALDARDAHR